jgi:hypothetical protein
MHPVRSAKLHDEEVHVPAGKDVKELKELNGQRVNVRRDRVGDDRRNPDSATLASM